MVSLVFMVVSLFVVSLLFPVVSTGMMVCCGVVSKTETRCFFGFFLGGAEVRFEEVLNRTKASSFYLIF